MMICKKCNAHIPDSVKFCPECGSVVNISHEAVDTDPYLEWKPEAQQSTPVAHAYRSPRTKQKKKTGIMIAGCIILGILFIFVEWIRALISIAAIVAIPISLIGFIVQAIRKKRKKNWGIAIIASILILIISSMFSSSCTHEWVEATCTEPKTCSLCGEVSTDALGHEFTDGSCTTPKTCSRCNTTDGRALGHYWQEATCDSPKSCDICGITEGEALGHRWQEATCKKPKYCVVCGVVDADSFAHTVNEWKTTRDATCTEKGVEEGICVLCSEVITQETDTLPHTEGEWEITKDASAYDDGEKSVKCTVCGEVLKTEDFSLSAEEIEASYKAKCSSYAYNDIARSPDNYIGEYATFYGKVLQVMQEKSDGEISYTLRIGTGGSYYYDNVILATYTASTDEPRILEDDMVTVYGMLFGEYTYETVLGNEMTLPIIFLEYVN